MRMIPNTRYFFSYKRNRLPSDPGPGEAPRPDDCKELYAAQSVFEKGYAQMNRPFAVSIHKKGAFYATGALLDHSWILTSAGEFYK